MPSAPYSTDECCPSGYHEINSIVECKAAWERMHAVNSNVFMSVDTFDTTDPVWVGLAEGSDHPSGCYANVDSSDTFSAHFNPTNVVGNSIVGNDKVLCKREGNS